MKILHISDTHNLHRQLGELPKADVIVHSGDFTFGGSQEEAFDFINWFCDLPYPHKIFIAGNHDACLFGAGVDGLEGLPEDTHFLYNSGVEIDGVKFYGVPMFFEDVDSGQLDQFYREIPEDVDVLVTHQPPYGICDLADYGHGFEHRGSKVLRQRNDLISPQYHLFGHEHETNGVVRVGATVFSNAVVVDRYYRLQSGGRVFELECG